eukprot:344194-Prymnesium_polylepis.1
MRSERPRALRDRRSGPGKDSGQTGGSSHVPNLPQRPRPENAPIRGLSKVTAHNVSAEREDRAHA